MTRRTRIGSRDRDASGFFSMAPHSARTSKTGVGNKELSLAKDGSEIDSKLTADANSSLSGRLSKARIRLKFA